MTSDEVARRKTVRLTTRGRKTGEPRTATIWFVADGPKRIVVQNATGASNWYRNLAKDPDVTLDFGTGPITARAEPIRDPARIRQVLDMIRRKHWATAWLIQLLGRNATPVAAAISWD